MYAWSGKSTASLQTVNFGEKLGDIRSCNVDIGYKLEYTGRMYILVIDMGIKADCGWCDL